jgi:hypothetical protein
LLTEFGLPRELKIHCYNDISLWFSGSATPLAAIWERDLKRGYKMGDMPGEWTRFWHLADQEYLQGGGWICIEQCTGRLVVIDLDYPDPIYLLNSTVLNFYTTLAHFLDWSEKTGGSPAETIHLRDALRRQDCIPPEPAKRTSSVAEVHVCSGISEMTSEWRVSPRRRNSSSNSSVIVCLPRGHMPNAAPNGANKRRTTVHSTNGTATCTIIAGVPEGRVRQWHARHMQQHERDYGLCSEVTSRFTYSSGTVPAEPNASKIAIASSTVKTSLDMRLMRECLALICASLGSSAVCLPSTKCVNESGDVTDRYSTISRNRAPVVWT